MVVFVTLSFMHYYVYHFFPNFKKKIIYLFIYLFNFFYINTAIHIYCFHPHIKHVCYLKRQKLYSLAK